MRPDRHRATTRYGRTAAWLHWSSAALILALYYLGLTFTRMPAGPDRVALCAWHKSLGLLLLLLAVVRVIQRRADPPPPLPATLSPALRRAAEWGHRAVYALMILVPVTGLAAATDKARPVIRLIGGMEMPGLVLPGDMMPVHRLVAYAMAALLVVHIGAALWHQWIRRDLAGRMPPFGAAG